MQIPDVPEDVHAGLVARAGEENLTVPELLRREAERLARTPSMARRPNPVPASTARS